MTVGILIPVVLLAIVVPIGLAWAKKNLKDAAGGGGELPGPPSGRLTSGALRELPTPPWRVVYEIADEKLGGIGHVLIGPAGAFAITTSMEPLPNPPDGDADPHEVARVAVTRGELDDALARCAMASEALVTVHWGANPDDRDAALDVMPGHVAVDGRRLAEWATSLPSQALSAAQVDLAWQTVLTSIGRPDPLA